MANDGVAAAWLTLTGALTLALLLVLLLRLPLRRWCGAGAAYQAWLLAPLAMLVSQAPGWSTAQPPALASLPMVVMVKAAGSTALSASAQGGWGGAMLAAWLAGALIAALLLVRAQRRFVRSLGPLVATVSPPHGEVFLSQQAWHGPLLLGLRHPIIVLPVDFYQRYSTRQQSLIIAHEQLHRRRRDPLANALLAACQCLFWFHPLVQVAASRCRFDQELACDALVMAAFPEARGAYAEALLQTQLFQNRLQNPRGGMAPPASCHWQSTHPLKERIMNLQALPYSSSRRLAGRILLLACAGLCAYGVAAARATGAANAANAANGPNAGKPAPIYQLEVTVHAGAAVSTHRMRAVAPASFALRGDDGPGKRWGATFQVAPAGPGQVRIATTMVRNTKVIGEPVMMTALGARGTVRASGDNEAGNYELNMVVTEVQSLLPPASM